MTVPASVPRCFSRAAICAAPGVTTRKARISSPKCCFTGTSVTAVANAKRSAKTKTAIFAEDRNNNEIPDYREDK